MHAHYKNTYRLGLLTLIGASFLSMPANAQQPDYTSGAVPAESARNTEVEMDLGFINVMEDETDPKKEPTKIKEVDKAPSQPEAAKLKKSSPEAPKAQGKMAPVEGQGITLPKPQQSEEFDEALFFDADGVAPQGELARKGAPSRVNPAISSGASIIVSKKNYSANSPQARQVAAERAMKLGRFESALYIYDELYAKNKRDPNILLGRAVALQKVQRNGEAIQAYEELLAIRPQNVEANINLQGLMSTRYPSVALRNLKDLHEQYPGDTGIIAQMAVVEAKLGRFDDAIRYLGMASSLEPRNANHLYNMAVISDRASERAKAIDFYEQALEVDTLYGVGQSVPRESIFQRLAELR